MSVEGYISIALVVFNVLLGLIAFFGGIVIRGLADSVKELRAAHERTIKDLGEYVKKDDYRSDVADLKSMIGRLFDRIDALANK